MSMADMEQPTVVVKEDGNGVPYLAFEPGMMMLRFREPVTLETAHETAKWLRKTFDFSTLMPYVPPPPFPDVDSA